MMSLKSASEFQFDFKHSHYGVHIENFFFFAYLVKINFFTNQVNFKALQLCFWPDQVWLPLITMLTLF